MQRPEVRVDFPFLHGFGFDIVHEPAGVFDELVVLCLCSHWFVVGAFSRLLEQVDALA